MRQIGTDQSTLIQRPFSDEKLPQMGMLMKVEYARGVFERVLRLRVENCRIARVKYRPGKNLLVTYFLKLSDQSDELQMTVMACGEGESLSIFTGAQKQPLVPTVIGQAVFHLPELEAVVWVFPNDRKLIGLLALSDPGRLRKLLLPEVVENSECEIVDLTSEVVHYAAERACTVRVGLALRNTRTGDCESRVLFGKTYCLDEGEFSWRAQQHLWESEARKQGLLLIPRPLAYQPEIKTIWQSGLEGKTLIEFDAQSERFSELLAKAGLSVAILHNIQTPFAPLMTITDVFSKLEAASKLISSVRPSYSEALKALVDRLIASYVAIGTRPKATLHGDLHLKNFFVTDNRIALIDLDNLCQGDPLLDVGSFIASLYYRGLLEKKPFEETEQIADHFTRAYRAGVGWEVPESAVSWHLAAALIYERAYRCMTRMKAGRLAIIDDIIDLAQRLGERV